MPAAVEVDLVTTIGMFRAAVPSGASTGTYEALELRDVRGGDGLEPIDFFFSIPTPTSSPVRASESKPLNASIAFCNNFFAKLFLRVPV